MIANYGYEDGSGFYYITIDGDSCAGSSEHSCVKACPQRGLCIEMDDYDDLVAVVGEARASGCGSLFALQGAKRERAATSTAALHDGMSGGRPAAQLVTVVEPRRTLDVRVDGETVTVDQEATVLEACDAAGHYVPRLCSLSRSRGAAPSARRPGAQPVDRSNAGCAPYVQVTARWSSPAILR